MSLPPACLPLQCHPATGLGTMVPFMMSPTSLRPSCEQNIMEGDFPLCRAHRVLRKRGADLPLLSLAHPLQTCIATLNRAPSVSSYPNPIASSQFAVVEITPLYRQESRGSVLGTWQSHPSPGWLTEAPPIHSLSCLSPLSSVPVELCSGLECRVPCPQVDPFSGMSFSPLPCLWAAESIAPGRRLPLGFPWHMNFLSL